MTSTSSHVVPGFRGGPAAPARARRWRRRPIGRHAVAPSPSVPRVAHLAREVLLTLGAVLGLAVTLTTFVAARDGVRPLIVRSGSMEPTIATGALVLVDRVPAPELRVGDVVAVTRPDRTRVIHRIVGLERAGGTAVLRLKGDANPDADPGTVTVAAADRLVRQVPAVGRAAAWLATPPGGFAVGAVMAALATLVLVRRSPAPASRAHGA